VGKSRVHLDIECSHLELKKKEISTYRCRCINYFAVIISRTIFFESGSDNDRLHIRIWNETADSKRKQSEMGVETKLIGHLHNR
jgi:hypothetical protein